MPTLGGLGACPPGNFEKIHSLRLNLRAFLVIDHPLMLLWDTGTENFLKSNYWLPACLYPCNYFR